MGQALYRKYRSKKLSEVVGQEHITTALKNALKQGKMSHAYLFTGPRGTGKTSVARILAHELNGLKYDEEATNLDIIEIDAASNRRIDEIRELRDRVHNAPTSSKYKVYIIDEVHMLTREAFNALLKTLEEPPEHAIFILATTEAHKLPETIISRTQRYSFKPIENDKAVKHLEYIAKNEKIDIDPEALELIAEHGEGSFRDSISLLDQVRHSSQKVSADTIRQNLGIAPEKVITELIQAVAEKQPNELLAILADMHSHGFNAPQVAKQLSEHLRQQLINQDSTLESDVTSGLLKQLLNVSISADPDRYLEIILLEASLAGKSVPKAKSSTPKTDETGAETPKVVEKPEKQEKSEAIKKPEAKPSPRSNNITLLDEESWQSVLQAIKARHNTLYSVARMAVPNFAGNELTLTFSFPFHQKRLNEDRNKKVISDVIAETTGQKVTITCVVDVNARVVPAAMAQPSQLDPNLQNISNIFGGGEVLE